MGLTITTTAMMTGSTTLILRWPNQSQLLQTAWLTPTEDVIKKTLQKAKVRYIGGVSLYVLS
jgi:hypothetical protein